MVETQPDVSAVLNQEELFFPYTKEPVIVLDCTDLTRCKVAVRQNKVNYSHADPETMLGEWVPRTIAVDRLWTWHEVWDDLDREQQHIEKRYFEQMQFLSTHRKALDVWFHRAL